MTYLTYKRCRLGILGAGRIGKLHAENIQFHLPQFQLMAIADPALDKSWAERLQIPFISGDSRDIIEREDIDAILIASPSSLHIEQIKAASAAGKAIFCEKPIGLTEESIQEALTRVEANHTLLQLGFNRRFDHSFATLQAQIRAGDIGSLQILRISSRDPVCPPKGYAATSGDLFMDMTIHDFDMARFLTSCEVVEVYASGAVLIDPDFEACQDVDTAIIQLRFANGALGVIDNSRQAVYGYDQRIEAFGSQGMLLADNQPNHTVKHYRQNSTTTANPKFFFLERYQQAFIAELLAFHDAWQQSKPSPVSGWDGLQALRIARAAKQSLATGLPVHLD
ncbi:inositol 2-dehydrogenase [Legionella erythra]|uniref:Myo-inositol-2-dehydrogenase n=1 Tax=Legionella erythra TaxID=448 RepID=A0A0W0TKH1_LEGER|nr:inositol 2-dehydrogenase [Legionella erythra]KTC96086.1 myo-inositol-2-dehydrogenase [Legionella erythra]